MILAQNLPKSGKNNRGIAPPPWQLFFAGDNIVILDWIERNRALTSDNTGSEYICLATA